MEVRWLRRLFAGLNFREQDSIPVQSVLDLRLTTPLSPCNYHSTTVACHLFIYSQHRITSHFHTFIKMTHFKSLSVSKDSNILKFIDIKYSLSFLFQSDPFYLLTVAADDYCCTWSYSDTHTHSVGLLWTSDQPDAENSDNTQHSQLTDIYTPAWFEPVTPTSERPKTYASDRAVSGIGRYKIDGS